MNRLFPVRCNEHCAMFSEERNSCRYCRFRRCLQVGMNPDAVRPDRDRTGKQRVFRLTKSQRQKITPPANLSSPLQLPQVTSGGDDDEMEMSPSPPGIAVDDWTKFLNSDLRKTLVDLLNLETNVVNNHFRGLLPASYSLRALVAERSTITFSLDTKNHGVKQTKAADLTDLSPIAIWRIVAVVDFVHGLCSISEANGRRITLDDKVKLVKHCFPQLLLLNLASKSAVNANTAKLFDQKMNPINEHDTTINEKVIEKTIQPLVNPLALLSPSEAEIVLLKAIVAMNPEAVGLSVDSVGAVTQLRDLMQELLFKSIKKSRPKTTYASAQFGNYLLILPTLQASATIFVKYIRKSVQPMPSINDFVRDLLDSSDEYDARRGTLGIRTKRCNDKAYSAKPTDRLLTRSDHQIIDEISTLITDYEVCKDPGAIEAMLGEGCEEKTPGDPFAALFKKPLQLTKSLDAILATASSPVPVDSDTSNGSQTVPVMFDFGGMRNVVPSASTIGQATLMVPGLSNVMADMHGMTSSSMNYRSAGGDGAGNFARPNVPPLKLPLQLTRSIEEMLRATGGDAPKLATNVDFSSLNTPSFRSDMMAMFFPEFLGNDTPSNGVHI